MRPSRAAGASDADRLLDVLSTAASLRLDALAAATCRMFDGRGIATIVLKGPTIADWLYEDGATRTYTDADIMVPPEHWMRARELMMELGYVSSLSVLAHPRMESITSEAWTRGDDEIDLHCTLWGLGADPSLVWETFSRTSERMAIGGSELAVLGAPARAMHLALHLAQHGDPTWTPAQDLERAISLLSQETWIAAAAIASQLQALPSFAAGLRMVPAGIELAQGLSLGDLTSTEASLRFEGVPLAQGFEYMSKVRGLRPKLRLAFSELFPTPAFMRWWSPLASKSRAGLWGAYVYRVGWIARHAVPGLLAWRRARSEARISPSSWDPPEA